MEAKILAGWYVVQFQVTQFAGGNLHYYAIIEES